MMRTTDRIIAKSRGTLAEAVDYARRHDALEPVACADYLQSVYELGELVGVDASVVIAQSVHETDSWRSHYWTARLNPAGMGITGDPAQNAQSPMFDSGAEAADAHVSHLLCYALGPADAGSLWYQKTGRSIANDDPRYTAYLEAFGNTAKGEIIDDFGNGVWATDPAYSEKWVSRGNAIYPNLADQTSGGGGVAMPTIPVHWSPVPAGAGNNPSGMLLPGNLIVVWHENGNPNSDANNEAAFLMSGGGPSRVSYHFAVDHEKAYQMFALNELCWHAADGCDNPSTDRGCFRGVAIEHCQDRDHGRWDATKRNGAILTAMIISGHPSIHFAGREGDFSPDRIETHQAVSETNKHCPDWMLDEGAIPSQIAKVRGFLAMDGSTTPSTTTTAAPNDYADPRKPPEWTGADVEAYGEQWTACRRQVTALKNTARLRNFDTRSPRVGPDIPKGTEFMVDWLVKSKGGNYFVTPYGTVVGAGNVSPAIAIRARRPT